MADDVTLPGDGSVIATDDVGGRQFQLVKMAYGADGEANPVSADAPLPMAATGELVEAIEAMRMAVHSLSRSIGQMQPDAGARMRVALDSITAGLTLATLTTVGTVSTVTSITTLANQANVGGIAANEQVPSLMRLGAEAVRRNIVVS
jgi:hypothetical protein